MCARTPVTGRLTRAGDPGPNKFCDCRDPKRVGCLFYSLQQDPSHVTWAKDFVLSKSARLLNPSGPTSTLEIPKTKSNHVNCLQLSEWNPISTEEEEALGEELDSLDEVNDNSPPERSLLVLVIE